MTIFDSHSKMPTFHLSPDQRLCHGSGLRSFSAAAAPQTQPNYGDDVKDDLPSNLTFDKRSSFAPKENPLLVVPPTPTISAAPIIDDDNVEEETNAGVQEVATTVTSPLAKQNLEIVDYEDDEYDNVDHIYDDDDDDFEVSSALGNVRPVIPLPDRLHQTVYHGPDGSQAGTIWLDASVFGVDPVRIDLIKQNVDYIRNKIRGRRKAKTKTVSEVSGSGRKVRQQKGSGRARAGHSRPAHWRGGAKAHGPKNTVDYGNVKLNKKAKTLAMRSTLSQKVKEGNLVVVNHLQLPSHKTKDFASVMQESYGIGKEEGLATALILDHYLERGEEPDDDESFHASYRGVPINLWVASSNIFKVKVANQRFANVYDILKREKLVVTLSALEEMERRWREV
jgi:large subunit ribosomal protein L4